MANPACYTAAMDARTLFLADHARIHTLAVSADDPAGATLGAFSYEDATLYKLSDADLVTCPEGGNSLAWLLWHMTRIEDVVVNTLLRGVPEVLDRDDWIARVGVDARDVGTSNSDDEIAGFSARVDVSALRAYRASVGRETRAWASAADFDALVAPPDVDARLAAAPPALHERARWLKKFWTGKPGLTLLSFAVVGHAYIHFGEAQTLRKRLGHSVL